MWIQISSGRGSVECERAVFLFTRAVAKELTECGIKVTEVESELGCQKDCFKSTLLAVDVKEAQKLKKGLTGTVLWICKSRYRLNVKRKNWFIAVNCIEDFSEAKYDLSKIVYTTMRSSGAGGQNVNKVETGVRATYLPLNLSVVSTKERSQHVNKKLAKNKLLFKLNQLNEKKQESLNSDIWSKHNKLIRGNPIRTYKGEHFIREFW